jgi:NADH:ubiquinone oxidoreductase subunit 6 (subunit J)
MDVEPSAPPTSGLAEQALSRASRLLVAGYVLAVVMPIAGFVIGIILVNRSEARTVKQGVWMIALSVVATFVLFVVLIVSMHTTLGEDG